MTDALNVTNVTKTFGGLTAVNNVTLSVTEGERRAIIGPNGAGKTTLFNLIAGQLHVDHGHVCVFGVNVTGLAVHKRARLGVSRTFQLSTLFGELTVRQQIQLAVIGREHTLRTGLFTPLSAHRHVTEQVDQILATWDLTDVADTPSVTLGYGTKRLIELVLATATKPRLLLLDEPTAGVDASDAKRIVDTISALPRDITVLLVEHDMKVAFHLADTVTVLTDGTELVTDIPDVVARNQQVIDAYLGRQEV
ncbi:MAG: ABC transporter ATP-binding protein [Nitriliruptoraceae bacterium]